MESQGEPVQMAESGKRDPTDRPLADLGKDGVSEFPESGRQHPDDAVADYHADRHHDQRVAARAEDVDRFLVEDRYVDGRDLGEREQGERHHHPQLDLDLAPRPEIREKRDLRAPLECHLAHEINPQ